MQAQITTFAEAATLIPDWLRLRLYFLRDGAFSLSPVRFALPDRTHFCRHGRNDSRWRHGAGVNLGLLANTWPYGTMRMVGVGMVVVFGLLNAIGVEVFGKVEVFLTFGMWTTLTIFGLYGGSCYPRSLIIPGGLAHRLMSVIFLVCLVILACLCSSVVNWVTPMAPEVKAHHCDSQAMAWPFSGGRLYVPLWRCD